jgi:transcriptional regulator with XRE-family HTH domain
MDAGNALHSARVRAGLTQDELAARTGTSQAAISAYESGAKQPTVATFSRLLAATGARLEVDEGGHPAVREPSQAQLARAGRTLMRVLELAEALPVRHERELRFPPLPVIAPERRPGVGRPSTAARFGT